MRVGQGNASRTTIQAVPEWRVSRRVIHVITLNPFIHGSKPTANDRVPTTGEIVGKSNARPEGVPCVVDQPFGNAILSFKTNTVQVKLITCQLGHRACAQAWAAGIDLRVVRAGHKYR